MARSFPATGGGGSSRIHPPAPRPSNRPDPERRRQRMHEREKKPEEEQKPTVKKRALEEGRNFLFDLMAAVIVLLIIIGALFTYTGNWPPLVVVQSGSMEHSEEASSVGVIDTGDLVFVKKMGDVPIVPYYDGNKTGHRTYSSYGDVIIFRPNGNEERTAIIHRAVIWIKFNDTRYDPDNLTGGSFDIPSMGIYNERGKRTIKDYEWPSVRNIEINLGKILSSFSNNYPKTKKHPHSGFITKGDDNLDIDQTSQFHFDDPWLEPVKEEWVIGKSVGELPWFGIIKLWMEGKEDWHTNSQKNLIISLIVIVLSPFVIDLGIHLISKVGKKEREEPEEELTGRRRLPGSRKKVDHGKRDEPPPRRAPPRRASPGPRRPPSG
jgi:signal peptidase I